MGDVADDVDPGPFIGPLIQARPALGTTLEMQPDPYRILPYSGLGSLVARKLQTLSLCSGRRSSRVLLPSRPSRS
jgi:hypothetical protein